MSKAEDAFFEAKHQIRDALAYRVTKQEQLVATLEAEFKATHGFNAVGVAAAKAKLEAYNEIYSFVRNAVLFNTEKYK